MKRNSIEEINVVAAGPPVPLIRYVYCMRIESKRERERERMHESARKKACVEKREKKWMNRAGKR